MKLLTYILALTFIVPSAMAQQKFITEGKIEYERKTNQHAFLDENSAWDEMAKKAFPKFLTQYYDLTFKDDRTFFTAGREPEVKQNKHWGVMGSENTIYTNLDSSSAVTQHNVYGEIRIVADSLRHIEWKISPEIRKIAGFDCRKAVGRIMDSIVVIAFYTDEILTPGGPESFTGLPGMILGVAIPRLHTTWYATKLSLVAVTDKDFALPKKGKRINMETYRKEVKELLKDWDEAERKRREFQLLL